MAFALAPALSCGSHGGALRRSRSSRSTRNAARGRLRARFAQQPKLSAAAALS
jgi:hypothetical protein